MIEFIVNHQIFFWGVFGSLAIEIVDMANYVRLDKPLPRRYGTIGFWVVNFGMAIVVSNHFIVARQKFPLRKYW